MVSTRSKSTFRKISFGKKKAEAQYKEIYSDSSDNLHMQKGMAENTGI